MAYDKTTFLSGLAMGLIGKGNPTFEGSGKMLYNGVELSALPKWNKVAYPHVWISVVSFGAAGNSYYAIFTSEPLVAYYDSEQGYVRLSSNHKPCLRGTSRYSSVSGKWTGIEWSELMDEYVANNPHILWSNTDIPNRDNGTIYFAASDPVLVEDTFTKGYHVGATLRSKRRLPVAYLYNGVRLPKLPKRDEALLPYVTMYWHTPSARYIAYAHSEKWVRKQYYDPISGYYWVHEPEVPCLCQRMGDYTPDVDTEWAGVSSSITEGWGDADGEWWKLSAFNPVWTNYDSLNEDGSLYFAASEPIPVYE